MRRPRCFQDGKCACYAVAFGLGMTLACCFPSGFTLFVMSIIIVCLGAALIHR
ncbi:hypothetical protein ACVS9P_05960 [Caproicibacterium sp. NSD3]|uniref:hypothetical protein n=1 Tax=Caproicibacterium sp. BJN0003 TaxID=2994078 RepID=UPI001597CDFB|nr:hypothetical protein [Caproicibacterium sp. BJN0003]MCI1951267.1 hypothetical protein [Clostridiales bacterium]MCI2161784.1 hypothetical protein [Oscillospiraceae bacterium]CAB1249082.1 Putative lipoprotein [Ruminococcaceae bacterium BL-4]MCI1960444.1 hypothetical protein [Clostridiales bacterium]MCI2020931.1 hypothetical protein [Clostridiales bacterium]